LIAAAAANIRQLTQVKTGPDSSSIIAIRPFDHNGSELFACSRFPHSGFGVYPIDRLMSIEKYNMLWSVES
jgi:hypothetical protein